MERHCNHCETVLMGFEHALCTTCADKHDAFCAVRFKGKLCDCWVCADLPDEANLDQCTHLFMGDR